MTITKTNIANQTMIMLGGLLITDVDTDSNKRATTLKELYDVKRRYLLRKYWWKFATKRIQLVPIEYTLSFDAQTVAFTVGLVVSGATGEGTIAHILKTSDTAGILYLTDVTTGFVDDETITDSGSGSADANGVEAAASVLNEFDYIYALPSDYIQLRELYPDYLDYRLEANFILSGESSTLDIKYTYDVTDPNEFDAMFVEAFAALMAKEAAIRLTDSKRTYKAMIEEFDDKVSEAKFSGSIEDDLEEIQADDWLSQRI